jgi:hypothetical protein
MGWLATPFCMGTNLRGWPNHPQAKWGGLFFFYYLFLDLNFKIKLKNIYFNKVK